MADSERVLHRCLNEKGRRKIFSELFVIFVKQLEHTPRLLPIGEQKGKNHRKGKLPHGKNTYESGKRDKCRSF